MNTNIQDRTSNIEQTKTRCCAWSCVFALAVVCFGVWNTGVAAVVAGAEEKVVALIAGPDSHGYGEHEHYAGMKLVGDLINANVKGVQAEVYKEWPADSNALEKVAAVVIFADGTGNGILPRHMKQLEPLMARGVEPFEIHDEWYYHMRFREKMEGVTPILTAVPPDETHNGGDSMYGGNPAVRARKGVPEDLMWVYQRPGGGRGFGFTGVHAHWSWANDNFRKVLLNAVVWTAGFEVPTEGVKSPRPTIDELMAGIPKKQPAEWKKEKVEELIKGWE